MLGGDDKDIDTFQLLCKVKHEGTLKKFLNFSSIAVPNDDLGHVVFLNVFDDCLSGLASQGFGRNSESFAQLEVVFENSL